MRNYRAIFQGGGIRAIHLLAAAAELGEWERNRKVYLTRLSGTSAGAIVAAMYAISPDKVIQLYEDLRERRSNIPEAITNAFPPPSYWKVLRCLAFKSPIWDQQKLRAVLTQYIDPDIRFSALTRPLCLVATDLETRSVREFSATKTPEMRVLDCALHSAAVPFAFRTWKYKEEQPYVDGGLCENLPVAHIGGSFHMDGAIIAIGFERERKSTPHSLIEYLGALFDASINHSESRARNLIQPGHTLLLSAKTPSFDFTEGLNRNLANDIQTSKERAHKFLNDLLGAHTDPGSKVWHFEGPNIPEPVADLMQRIGHFYYGTTLEDGTIIESHTRRRPFRLLRASHEVIAYCLADDPSHARDRSITKLNFEIIRDEEFCLAFGSHRPEGVSGTDLMEVRARDKSGPLQMVILPMLGKGADDKFCRLCAVFTPPLQRENGPFETEMIDEPKGLMGRLLVGKQDELGLTLPRCAGSQADIMLILHVPKQWHISWTAKANRSSIRAMTECEISAARQQPPPMGYYSLGWIAEKADPGCGAGVWLTGRCSNA